VDQLPEPTSGSSRPGRAGLILDDGYRPCVELVGVLVRFADRREPHPPVFRQRAHHVEHDPGLPGLVEVESVSHGDIEQVVGGQASVRRGFQVVGGDEALGAPAGGGEDTALRVVCAVGEELQRQERMGRSSRVMVAA
jgi:hypothetical protein